MRDFNALEIRRLAARIESAERRIAMSRLTGKVVEKDSDNRRLRLKLGTSSTGTDVLSPWIRWQEAGAGGLSIHSEPAMGEQMDMISHSGSVGGASIAVPSTYDQDHEAPSKSSDTAVMARGQGRIEIGPDGLLFKGPARFEGPVLTHNDKNIGADHAHKDVVKGTENTGPPV